MNRRGNGVGRLLKLKSFFFVCCCCNGECRENNKDEG